MGCGSSTNAGDPSSTGAGGEFDEANTGRRQSYYKKPVGDRDGEGDFFEVEDQQGEKFMALKPWLGAIVAPDDPPASNLSKPDCNYELEYVYGYRSQDSR